jgi:hypothetical protein
MPEAQVLMLGGGISRVEHDDPTAAVTLNATTIPQADVRVRINIGITDRDVGLRGL